MGPDFTTDRYSQIESVVHLFYVCIYVHFAKLMNHLVINNINVHIFSHLTNLRKKQNSLLIFTFVFWLWCLFAGFPGRGNNSCDFLSSVVPFLYTEPS